MNIEFYRVLHLIGILMLFQSLGGALILNYVGTAREENPWRKPLAITHGIGLLIILIAGFGMLAKLGIIWPLPGWAIGKAVIWLALGFGSSMLLRKPGASGGVWFGVLALGAIAAYLAIYHPF